MPTITIAAVGDLLMKGSVIRSAKLSGQNNYSFDPIFAKVAPYLKKPDLTIGNLETTFSGDKYVERAPGQPEKYERRSPRSRGPLFNCPDQLAAVLKQSGFDVLTTVNNHCVDCGSTGLKRTLNILDKHGLAHTGTYRSLKESKKHLIMNAKGIKIGILAYTTGTNSLPVPQPWLINRISERKIIADIHALRKKTDFIIVCLHFGQEYHLSPNKRQKHLVNLFFKHGANAILGAHPHVLQPVISRKVKDVHGNTRKRVAAYSLGNFISSRLKKNNYTTQGMILQLTITKDRHGKTDITKIGRMKTNVKRTKVNGRNGFSIVPASSNEQADATHS